MSLEAAKAAIEKMKEDEAFKNKIMGDGKTIEERIKLIQDAGFDVTQEDIMQVQNELSDKELNRVVAAGKSSHCVIYIPCPCESRYHTGVAL